MANYNNFPFMQWFYDLHTKNKMMVLLAVVMTSMLAIAFTGLYFNMKANNSAEIIFEDNLKPIRWINLARIQLNANRTNLYHAIAAMGYDEDNVKKYIEDIDVRAKEIDENIELVNEKMKSLKDEYAQDVLNELKSNLNNYRSGRGKSIAAIISGDKDKALKLAEEQRDIAFNIIKNISDAAQHIQDRADKRNYKLKEDAKQSIIITIVVIVVALSLSTFLSLVTSGRIAGILGDLGERMKAMADGDLTVSMLGKPECSCIGDLCTIFDSMLGNLKTLVKSVSESAEQVAAGSEELNAASDQTAQGAQQTATSVTQLAAGTQEVSTEIEKGNTNINKINKAILEVSDESTLVAQLGNDTENTAIEGKELVLKAIDKIDNIKTVSGEISGNIDELGKLSAEIEQIVDLIKNIAGQTNLLALNAAIEAARAGEHGKGFAVVADEVKKLAAQSAGATDKITGMIKEIQNKTSLAVTAMDKGVQEVESGVVAVNDVGKALDGITAKANEANTKIQGINKQITSLTAESESIVKMIENISAVVEETAASAEEISSITEEQTASVEEINASSQSLAKIAEELQHHVSIFKV